LDGTGHLCDYSFGARLQCEIDPPSRSLIVFSIKLFCALPVARLALPQIQISERHDLAGECCSLPPRTLLISVRSGLRYAHGLLNYLLV
jgi:hypothetical protein